MKFKHNSLCCDKNFAMLTSEAKRKIKEEIPMGEMINTLMPMHSDMKCLLYNENYKNWEEAEEDQEETCSFCGDRCFYINSIVTDSLSLNACRSCYQQIKNGEIDLIANEDEVSSKLNTIFQEIIDNDYWYFMEAEEFNELKLDTLKCNICKDSFEKSIKHDHIQLSYVKNKFYVIHLSCYSKLVNSGNLKGFWEDQDYQEIIKYLIPKMKEALQLLKN